jgi:hypothetical protein
MPIGKSNSPDSAPRCPQESTKRGVLAESSPQAVGVEANATMANDMASEATVALRIMTFA